MLTTMAPIIENLFSIQGKTAIVTGGTGGLGSEMCLALAGAGAHIVALHLENDPGVGDLKRRVRELGVNFQGAACDIGDSAALRKTFAGLWDAGVVPDILLNCAGLNRRGPIESVTDDEFDLVSTLRITPCVQRR